MISRLFYASMLALAVSAHAESTPNPPPAPEVKQDQKPAGKEQEQDDNRGAFPKGTPATIPEEARQAHLFSPEEILDSRFYGDKKSEAVHRPLKAVTPVTKTFVVSLTPAEAIPVIHLSLRNQTVIAFTDATGEPWPIAVVSGGDVQNMGQSNKAAGSQDITQDTGPRFSFDRIENTFNNSLRLATSDNYSRTNLQVYLEGLSQPVTLMLQGNGDEYHYLATVKIKRFGPNAKQGAGFATVTDRFANREMDSVLDNVLYDVVPGTFQRINVNDGMAIAYLPNPHSEYLYLKTRLQIVSPNVLDDGVARSPDGTTVYKLPNVSPLTALNDNGDIVYLNLN